MAVLREVAAFGLFWAKWRYFYVKMLGKCIEILYLCNYHLKHSSNETDIRIKDQEKPVETLDKERRAFLRTHQDRHQGRSSGPPPQATQLRQIHLCFRQAVPLTSYLPVGRLRKRQQRQSAHEDLQRRSGTDSRRTGERTGHQHRETGRQGTALHAGCLRGPVRTGSHHLGQDSTNNPGLFRNNPRLFRNNPRLF